MTALALAKPVPAAKVRRSELRENQKKFFAAAIGSKIVEVIGTQDEDEKYIVDKQYFDEVIAKLRAAIETLAVVRDQKLFSQLLRASATMDEDIRLGKLHSFEDAFGE